MSAKVKALLVTHDTTITRRLRAPKNSIIWQRESENMNDIERDPGRSGAQDLCQNFYLQLVRSPAA